MPLIEGSATMQDPKSIFFEQDDDLFREISGDFRKKANVSAYVANAIAMAISKLRVLTLADITDDDFARIEQDFRERAEAKGEKLSEKQLFVAMQNFDAVLESAVRKALNKNHDR